MIEFYNFSHLSAIKQTLPFREKPVPGLVDPGIYLNVLPKDPGQHPITWKISQ
jgi:hypothetical protein